MAEPVRSFTRTQDIGCTPDRAFAFFSDVRHLARIAPPFLQLTHVTDPAVRIEAGTRIDYRVRLHGVPFAWRTRIVEVDPPRGFVYEQERGPIALWWHRYRLEAIEGGTRLVDEVRYRVGYGLLGRLGHRAVGRRVVTAMFDHRAERITTLLGTPG